MLRLPPPPPANTSAKKPRGRPFQPGQVGNPAGRPKGSRHRAYAALEAIGTGDVGDILREVVRKALDGDLTASRIILDRVWPAPRGRTVPIALPEVNTIGDLGAAHNAVTRALSNAEVTIDEAASLVAVLENRRRLIDTTDIERRLTRLEKETR